MGNYKFLFDLDSTVTQEEILPLIANEIGKGKEMRELTEATMRGDIPFEKSFNERVKILSTIPVEQVSTRVEKIKVNKEIVEFMNQNKEDCYIITSNLDVWIEKLMKKIGMQNNYFSSKAKLQRGKIISIENILSKGECSNGIAGSKIAIGDGSNDVEMIKKSNIGIGFGGVREVSPKLVPYCDHIITCEKELVDLLKKYANNE